MLFSTFFACSSQFDTTYEDGDVLLWMDNNGLTFINDAGTEEYVGLPAGINLLDGEWHYVGFTWNGKLNFFVDNVKSADSPNNLPVISD